MSGVGDTPAVPGKASASLPWLGPGRPAVPGSWDGATAEECSSGAGSGKRSWQLVHPCSHPDTHRLGTRRERESFHSQLRGGHRLLTSVEAQSRAGMQPSSHRCPLPGLPPVSTALAWPWRGRTIWSPWRPPRSVGRGRGFWIVLSHTGSGKAPGARVTQLGLCTCVLGGMSEEDPGSQPGHPGCQVHVSATPC